MGNKNWRRPIQSSDGNNRILCVNGWRIMWSILPWFLGVAQLAEGASKNRKLNSDSNSGMSWQVALAIFGSVFGVVLVVLCCVVLYAVYVTRQDEKDEHRAQTQAAIAASNESSAMTMENADSVLRRMQQGVSAMIFLILCRVLFEAKVLFLISHVRSSLLRMIGNSQTTQRGSCGRFRYR